MTTWQEKSDLTRRLNDAMNRSATSKDGQRAANVVVKLLDEKDAEIARLKAEIAALRARAEKAEAERDAAVEGKAEVFFAVEDRERFEATIARLKAEVKELGDLLLAERTSRNRVMAAKVVAHEQHQKEIARLTRALAAGVKALEDSWVSPTSLAAIEIVKAAQREAMEEKDG